MMFNIRNLKVNVDEVNVYKIVVKVNVTSPINTRTIWHSMQQIDT
jgi:hypothetical protein